MHKSEKASRTEVAGMAHWWGQQPLLCPLALVVMAEPHLAELKLLIGPKGSQCNHCSDRWSTRTHNCKKRLHPMRCQPGHGKQLAQVSSWVIMKSFLCIVDYYSKFPVIKRWRACKPKTCYEQPRLYLLSLDYPKIGFRCTSEFC